MIPVENIERIEVVRGAGSSLYGGHAVGGVVNIITKDAKKKGLNANIVLNYGSNNTWKKALYADVKANEKVSFGVGYEIVNRMDGEIIIRQKLLAKAVGQLFLIINRHN